MTGIHPVQGFNNLSKPKKAAVVAGAAVAAGAVATTAVAFAKGKQPDVKGLKAIKAGYGIIFEAAKAKATNIKNLFFLIFPKKEGKAAEVVADATEAVQDAAEAIQG